jgi:hypothetical protein
MKKLELKQLIKEVISESMTNEGFGQAIRNFFAKQPERIKLDPIKTKLPDVLKKAGGEGEESY